MSQVMPCYTYSVIQSKDHVYYVMSCLHSVFIMSLLIHDAMSNMSYVIPCYAYIQSIIQSKDHVYHVSVMSAYCIYHVLSHTPYHVHHVRHVTCILSSCFCHMVYHIHHVVCNGMLYIQSIIQSKDHACRVMSCLQYVNITSQLIHHAMSIMSGQVICHINIIIVFCHMAYHIPHVICHIQCIIFVSFAVSHTSCKLMSHVMCMVSCHVISVIFNVYHAMSYNMLTCNVTLYVMYIILRQYVMYIILTRGFCTIACWINFGVYAGI